MYIFFYPPYFGIAYLFPLNLELIRYFPFLLLYFPLVLPIDYHLQVKLNKIFDSIPAQLARESDTLKFKYSEVKKMVEHLNFLNHLNG